MLHAAKHHRGKICFAQFGKRPLLQIPFPYLLWLTTSHSLTCSNIFFLLSRGRDKTCVSWGRLKRFSPNSSGPSWHFPTLELTPPPPPQPSSRCRLSKQHPQPWEGGGEGRWGEGRGASHPGSTQHPRRKHGWQMGDDIRYRVSAWKIYKVRQWVGRHKKLLSYISARRPDSAGRKKKKKEKNTLVVAVMEKIISP